MDVYMYTLLHFAVARAEVSFFKFANVTLTTVVQIIKVNSNCILVIPYLLPYITLQHGKIFIV